MRAKAEFKVIEYGHPERIEVIVSTDCIPTNYEEYVTNDFDDTKSLNIPKHLLRLLFAEFLLLTGAGDLDYEVKGSEHLIRSLGLHEEICSNS